MKAEKSYPNQASKVEALESAGKEILFAEESLERAVIDLENARVRLEESRRVLRERVWTLKEIGKAPIEPPPAAGG